MVRAIKGTPDEPKTGVKSDKVPVYVRNQDHIKPKHDGKFEAPSDIPHIPVVRASNIYKGDVEVHGPSPGCKACNAILLGSERRHPHSKACRLRFENIFQEAEDPRIARMDQRIALAIQRKEESDKKRELEKEPEVEMETEAAAPAPVVDTQMTPEQARYSTTPERAWAERIARKRRAEENDEDGSHAEAQAQRVQVPGGVSSGSERGQKRQSDSPTDDPRANLTDQPEVVVDSMGVKEWTSLPGPMVAVAEFGRGNKSVVRYRSKDEAGSDVRKHPGPKMFENEITTKDRQWHDIGSGTFSKTFMNVDRMPTTTKSGPPMCDIHRRSIWILTRGCVIDDCIVDDTPGQVLHRPIGHNDNVRVELVMKGTMEMYRRKGADIVEVYSQPRIAQEATMFAKDGLKLNPGWSLDLTRTNPGTGKPWNLADPATQAQVRRMVVEDKPLFVVGSPPCTAFSIMQNISRAKRDPKIVEKELEDGRRHLKICTQLCLIQLQSGRFFVHEHPVGATSWKEPCMTELMGQPGVDTVVVDMCAFGMRVDSGKVQGPAMKSTRIASNSAEVLKGSRENAPTKDPIRHSIMYMFLWNRALRNDARYTSANSADKCVRNRGGKK